VGGSGAGDPWAGPIESLKEIDLGDITLGLFRQFQIPSSTLGFTILVTAPDPNEVIGLSRLRPPVGDSVIIGFAMAGHTTQTFANFGWITGADPQADSMDAYPVQEGTWRLLLGDDDGSLTSAHVSVWVRRTEDGLFHGGALDVNVFMAPGVTSQSYVNQVLGNMFPGYAGLDLGTVNFYDLDSAATVISTRDEMRSMVATSSAGIGTAPALNLFVIGNFGADFGQAIGVAGGIPGSAVQHGTPMSGLAYQPSGDAAYDATVLMHEIGHMGGLFHTTEFSVVETDPLSDTVFCDYQTIQSNADACPDKTNVMFPIAYGATTFSAAQQLVMQGSGLYRGIIQQGGQPSPPLPVAAPKGAPALVPLAPAGAQVDPLSRQPVKPRPASPDPLQRVLGGVWCAHGGDYEALAIRVAGANASSVLRSIVLDETASEVVRSRALGAYARAAEGKPSALSAALQLATQFATGDDVSRPVRLVALRVLQERDPLRAARAKPSALSSSDPVVRAAGEELR
jgi:hypothetical protein